MTEVERRLELQLHDSDGTPPAGSKAGRPSGLLVVLHTPSGKNVGAKHDVRAPVFTIGDADDHLVVEGASAAGTRAEIVWMAGEERPPRKGWRLKGSGRLLINGKRSIDGALASGDELRVVDSFFRFLAGKHAREKYYETIYQLSILDVPTNTHNERYLREVLCREKERAMRNGKPFSVAVVSVKPHQSSETAAHDLIRPVAKALKEGSSRAWVVARAGDLEFAVVSPATAPELESILTSRMPSCLPKGLRAQLGVVQHQRDLDPEQLVPKARAASTPLAG